MAENRFDKLKIKIMRFQDLLAYKKSFELAMDIYSISKTFPSEEKYIMNNPDKFL